MPTNNDIATRSLMVRAATIDDEGMTVEATITTEDRAEVFDWGRGVIDEILLADGMMASAQVPFLADHMRSVSDVLGAARDIRIEQGAAVARLYFDGEDERARKAFSKVKSGFISDVSVGYRVTDSVMVKRGESAMVNGREYTAGDKPLRVARQWQLREVSLVPIGADQRAKIRSEFGFNSTIERDSTMENNTGEQTRHETAQPPVTAPVATPAPIAPDPDAIVRAERERVAGIRSAAGNDPALSEIEARAIAEGWDVGRASREFLGAIRSARNVQAAPNINVQNPGDREQIFRSMAAGLMHRSGSGHLAKGARYNGSQTLGEREVNEGYERYRHLSMLEVCREALRLSGANVPHDPQEVVRAATSTLSVGAIFTTNIGAVLMQSYNEATDTTDFCSVRDVSSFKLQERPGTGVFDNLEKVARGSKAKHVTMSDVVETYKVSRYGKQLVIDEQDIIDDEIGAMSEFPQKFGATAARVRPDLVYSILLANGNLSDGTALFDNTRGNNGAVAFASEALKTAVSRMRKMQYDGVNLNLSPEFLIVTTELEWVARELLNSAEILIAGDTDRDRGTRNVVRDIGLNLRVDGRLSNGVTDPNTGTAYAGSATGWYLAASPATARTIEVGYLAGTGRAPSIRSYPLAAGQWGLGWDIKLDIGAKALDFRGLQRGNS